MVPLTAAQKYHFDTKGWLAIPGVLDGAEIEEMREFVLRLAAEPESIPEHRRSPVGGPLQRLTDHPVVIGFAQEFIYNPFTDGGGGSLENEAGYGFRQEHSFVTVRRADGGRRGAQGDGTFGPHNGNGMMRLPGDCHHYQAFPGHAYAGMTRIVWELNEVARDDGGTLLLSGSHKAAYPAPEEIFSADSSLWETCACPAGSVLMFTEALTHSGQPWRNPTRPRVAVFNCYNSIHAKWHNWDPPAAVLADMPAKRPLPVPARLRGRQLDPGGRDARKRVTSGQPAGERRLTCLVRQARRGAPEDRRPRAPHVPCASPSSIASIASMSPPSLPPASPRPAGPIAMQSRSSAQREDLNSANNTLVALQRPAD